MTLQEQVEAQARAHLAVREAQAALKRAETELRRAEKARSYHNRALTAVVDGTVVTSWRAGPDVTDWQYIVSEFPS